MPTRRLTWEDIDGECTSETPEVFATLTGRTALFGEDPMDLDEEVSTNPHRIIAEVDEQATKAIEAMYASEENEVGPAGRRLINLIKSEVLQGLANLRSQITCLEDALHWVGLLVRGSVEAHGLR